MTGALDFVTTHLGRGESVAAETSARVVHVETQGGATVVVVKAQDERADVGRLHDDAADLPQQRGHVVAPGGEMATTSIFFFFIRTRGTSKTVYGIQVRYKERIDKRS